MLDRVRCFCLGQIKGFDQIDRDSVKNPKSWLVDIFRRSAYQQVAAYDQSENHHKPQLTRWWTEREYRVDYAPILGSFDYRNVELLKWVRVGFNRSVHGYKGGYDDQGRKHGHGQMVLRDGGRYIGEFVHDKIEGQGTVTYVDGYVYEGGFVENKKDGQGKATYANGDRYEGSFQNGQRYGQGVYWFSDGGWYEGGWVENKKDGQGIETYPNGYRYEGDWVEGKQHGQGKATYVNGDWYEGSWYKGQKHGQGVYTKSNGDRYEGSWYKGQKHGQGVYTKSNGYRYEGDWVEGEQHGQGKATYVNGDRYEGAFQKGQKHGQAVEIHSNGDRFEGFFRQGFRHGPGTLLSIDGACDQVVYEDGIIIDCLSNKNVIHFNVSDLDRVVFLQAGYDHNHSFSQSRVNRLERELRKIGGVFNRSLIQSSEDLSKVIEQQNKIKVLWVLAHGLRQSVVLGGKRKDDYGIQELTPLLKTLSEKPIVVLDSCLGGQIENNTRSKSDQCLAEQILAKVPDATIIAASGLLITAHVVVKKNGHGSCEMKVVMLSQSRRIDRIFNALTQNQVVSV